MALRPTRRVVYDRVVYDLRMSRDVFCRLLFAFALVFAGSVAQLHSLSHAQHDLAAAGQGAKALAPLNKALAPLNKALAPLNKALAPLNKALAPLNKAPAPLTHATDQCLVIHALDGTAAETGAFLLGSSVSQDVVPALSVCGGEALAAAYRSRAPPQFG